MALGEDDSAVHRVTELLRAHFGRVTSGPQWIPQIDGLRFVAIALVFLFHLRAYVISKGPAEFVAQAEDNVLLTLTARGAVGVQLFFVISGLVLSLPFVHETASKGKFDVRKYFARRFRRLEPVYVVNLLLMFGLLVFVKRSSLVEQLPHLLASLTYVHNLVYQKASSINVVAWSLEIELQFYVLMPVLARIYRRSVWQRRSILTAAIVGGTVLAQLAGGVPWITLSFLGYSQYFVLGMLLADLHFRSEMKLRPEFWDAAGIFGWLALVALLHQRSWWVGFLVCPVILVAYLGVLRGAHLKSIFGAMPVAVVGGMCYTIYLYHFAIISFVGRWLRERVGFPSLTLTYLAYIGVIAPVVIAACAVLYALIERPFMKQKSSPTRL